MGGSHSFIVPSGPLLAPEALWADTDEVLRDLRGKGVGKAVFDQCLIFSSSIVALSVTSFFM